MESAETLLVGTVQPPWPLSTPPFTVQPAGTPAIVTVTGPTWPAGSLRPRLMGLPAMPAGPIVLVSCSVLLAVSPSPSTSVKPTDSLLKPVDGWKVKAPVVITIANSSPPLVSTVRVLLVG